MAARMAAQRRGLQMRQKQRDLLDFCLAHTRVSECPHSLFPHQQVLLGSWRLLSITHSGQQVDSGKGGDHPSIGRVEHTSQSFQSPICPLNINGCIWGGKQVDSGKGRGHPSIGGDYVFTQPNTTMSQYLLHSNATLMQGNSGSRNGCILRILFSRKNKQTSKAQPQHKPMQKDMHPCALAFQDVLL